MAEILETLKNLTIIAGGITAIGGIIKLVIKGVRAIDNILKAIKTTERHEFENHMSLLRLTIMSEEMPLGERIIAAEKYLKNDGNGEIKKFCIEHLHVKDVIKNNESEVGFNEEKSYYLD